MNEFLEALRQRLEDTRSRGLWRELRRVESGQGPWIELERQRLLNFSSNDYLGLARHPALAEAALEAIRRFGAGAGASRLVCGSLAPHHELEQALAALKGVPAAVAFGSGYAAALGTVPALVGPGDVVALDKLCHACLVDAARLSGARLRVFAHNDLEDLEGILRWAHQQHRQTTHPGETCRVLIITESVFSMDGDVAPLRELVNLKDKHGAWLLVDEAHATGLYGGRRRGLAEFFGVADRIEVQMGTLGKALGAAGGYVCGARELVEWLVNRARPFIFSTAPVPAQAAAARAAVAVVESDEGARLARQLWERVAELREGLTQAGWREGASRADAVNGRAREGVGSAIMPLVVGAEEKALRLSSRLREQGIHVPAIRYPTVPRGTARLRITVSAAHTSDDVLRLLDALKAMAAEEWLARCTTDRQG